MRVLQTFPDVPTAKGPGKKLPRSPTREEVEQMVEHSKGWVLVAVVLAFYVGLRSGELRALQVRDIDLERGLIFVRRAFSEKVLQQSELHEAIWSVMNLDLTPPSADAKSGERHEQIKNAASRWLQKILASGQKLSTTPFQFWNSRLRRGLPFESSLLPIFACVSVVRGARRSARRKRISSRCGVSYRYLESTVPN